LVNATCILLSWFWACTHKRVRRSTDGPGGAGSQLHRRNIRERRYGHFRRNAANTNLSQSKRVQEISFSARFRLLRFIRRALLTR
jgi:hypothetical protein